MMPITGYSCDGQVLSVMRWAAPTTAHPSRARSDGHSSSSSSTTALLASFCIIASSHKRQTPPSAQCYVMSAIISRSVSLVVCIVEEPSTIWLVERERKRRRPSPNRLVKIPIACSMQPHRGVFCQCASREGSSSIVAIALVALNCASSSFSGVLSS